MKESCCKLLKSKSTSFTELEQTAYKTLENWDGVMETSSVGASVFMVTNYHVMKYMLQQKLDEEFIKLYLNRVDHWDFLRNFLYQRTVPFEMQETPEDILYTGFKLAINELSNKHGDVPHWKWGNLHHIEFEHPLGKQKPLNSIFNVGPFGVNGGFNAVNKIMSHQGDHNYKVSSLPSTRRLIDMGNKEESYSVLPSGNSGHFQSTHYDDQVELFLKGSYRNLNFKDEQVKNQQIALFKLLPL